MKKQVIFNYCKDFKCVGKACKHNCCELWQIDIDGRTLKKYLSETDTEKGGFSDRLKNGVDFSNRRFIMKTVNGKKRCAFLNDDNLCDIIINLNEKYLCRTCRVHPRFKNYLPDRIETGVSLSCEEGARELLNFTDKIGVDCVADGVYTDPFFNFLYGIRKRALTIVQDRGKDINERIDELLTFSETDKERFYGADYIKILKSLNVLDGEWLKRVDKININIAVKKEYSLIAENLLTYFLIRRLINAKDKLEARSIIAFAVLGTLIIYSIFIGEGVYTLEAMVDIARAFSAEIEYDDENVFILLSELEEFLIHVQVNL